MRNLFGEYEATLDAKGRFLLPAALKKQLPQESTTYIIARDFEKCLVLYPMEVWEALANKVRALNDFNPKVRQFKTLFLAGATMVELDGAGRMLMPPSLKEYAGLQKDIVLACQFDKVKIWDSEVYKQFFEKTSNEEFSALGLEVLGDLDLSAL
jgi:MraZ protein